ncbi:desmocollin-1 isoform X1 [Canis lupus baileyi]|uniref:Desmocollin 1 n=3 Tax=Canis lupus TaxID=9612 RepID=A0A8C0LWT5_CANLF|nr:desmocollin-1 precursor [Canis lupus familiaris]XP_025285025.1 desmocollin-1 isoform X1 [Canis lupus dingo]|eukprot:NP_001300789.1 desmocollin-1 precursor [Canis lupus familiaris]
MAVASAASGSIFCKQLLFCLLVLILSCDACQKISLQVPSHLQAETLVGKVNLKECFQSASLILSSDPDFRILEDGSIYTTHDLILSSERKSFSIFPSDSQSQEQKKIEIVLDVRGKKVPKKRHTKDTVLKRSKRRWAPIPCSLMENSLGPFPQHVQQVQSDAAQNYTIFYSISGPGVDKEPFNLFYIDKDTGDIFCTRSIDREQYEQFPLYAYATTADGYAPEYPLPLLFKVEDDNDNAPYFENKVTIFNVPENCRTGTSVGQVTAIDLDEPDTLHTRLKYKILQQIPDHPKHFSIHPDTGVITTTTPLLDRENCDTYKLIMEVRDMGGQPFGLFNTGTITISLDDENDNPPYFTETSYFAEVEENRIDVEILRMAVHDQDLPNTPHSKAVYQILQGNENGNFKISTDPNTNEAVLCVVKPLNYEVNRQVVLQIGVLNEAQFTKAANSKTPTMCTTTVTVKIKDSDEGPECQPPVKVVQSKDGLPAGEELRGYKALDPETLSGEGLRYKKIGDEDNWFEINEHTGDLRTIKVLDRESKFVKNDQYNVSVVAMDTDGRSCTGTLVVLLEDNNDHPPQIEKEVTICQNAKDYAVLKPVDPDGPENGPPFQFFLDNSANKLWNLETKDGKTAILHQRQVLDYNYYTVPIIIKDRHGLHARHMLTVRVCDCTTPSDCKMKVKNVRDVKPSNVILGRWAILAMVLGSALLLCILFTCFCVTAKRTVKKCFPDVAQQNLIVSNTEGPGEEVMEANIRLPTQTSNICDTSMSVGTLGGQGVKTQQSFEMVKGGYTLDSNKGGGHQTLESVKGAGQGVTDAGRYTYTDWHSFTQPRLGEKVYLCGQDEEHKHSEDYVRSYNYEGKGSVAGSVGCCSDRQEEEGLEFLDHLEPKFRTLAKTCAKK